jgi:peptidyl-prolyl cis-trans isomerase SurA
LRDLSFNAEGLGRIVTLKGHLPERPAGVPSLQDFRKFRFRFALGAILLFAGAFISSLAGCHRSPSGDVVATVNGKEILRAELERNYQIYLAENPQKPSPQEADIQRLNVLRQMIQNEVWQQQAAKLNLTASDEDVNARLTEIKAPYTEDQFYNLLKQRNMSLDDLKRDIRRQLTENKLMNKEIESKINITDAQIADFYEQHKPDFNVIEPQYHIARILVTTAPAQQAGNLQNSKATGDADAKKKIDALRNRLESGEDFATVAANFSEDPQTAPNGGDMGFVPESALRSNLEVYGAITKLKPGQFTDVLPVYDETHRVVGYAIYKFLGREPAGQRLLSDPNVRQSIHTTLHDAQKQLLQTAYLETLMDEAKVRNFLAEQILKQGGQ